MKPFVLFDLDNTLIDRKLALVEWAAEFCALRGLGTQEAEWVRQLFKDRAGPGQFVEVRERFGFAEPAEQLWRDYCSDIAASVHCPSDVLVGLDELRAAGWRIGIATNGAADIQWAKLRATGIARRVDAVCISEEVGARKPDRVFFLEAIRRCKGDAGGTGWIVGDNPVTDIDGGRDAGLRTVWINRGVVWPDGCLAPDHEVSGARAAIDLLAAAAPEREPQ
ncbi:HAD family hydrolase [Streptomyces sp. NPDC060232]|uniref:HAD family hydrolase n=1 Tax=Streptomyces sp. NPDC060232 TaxID=3347079 RepID=UPI00364BEEA3